MKVKVTPIKTQGKKTKLVSNISDEFNKIKESVDLYIEPFVGSGAVGFNIAGENAIFSDRNPNLINFYNSIKDKSLNNKMLRDYLERESEKLKVKGVDHYNLVRARYNKEKSPYDFLFINRSCFNGLMRFNKKGMFNVPFCQKPERFSKGYITKIVNEFSWVEEKIHNNNWVFIESDFRDIIKQNIDNEKSFIYLDPPYIMRNSSYYNEWLEEDEIKLFDMLNEYSGKFIMSNWIGNSYRENPYFKEYWSKFDYKEIKHTYQIGSSTENRKEMTESIILKI